MKYDPLRVIENALENRSVHHITCADKKGHIRSSFDVVFLKDVINELKGWRSKEDVGKSKLGE
jgi:hypothetical protein